MSGLEFSINKSVRHKSKKLYEAKIHGWSKSGKRIGVLHNACAPWGVCWVVDYFDPKNIEPGRIV